MTVSVYSHMSSIRSLRIAAVSILATILLAYPAPGQPSLAERVLVVYNSSAAESLAVARYYMTRRAIPESLRCKISTGSTDYIRQEEFDSRVKAPIRSCLEKAGRQKILYIVFSYQTPYVVTFGSRAYSLDQLVADIWDEYLPAQPGELGKPQPYFGDAESQGGLYVPFMPLAAYREQPGSANIYSVWRLDAANADLAKSLVAKAMIVESRRLTGRGCFDRQYGPIDGLADAGSSSGDWDIHQAAEFARRAGFEVTEDEQAAEFGTPPAPLRCENAALYAGWYSLNHYNDAFTWAPGAIGFHLDSASAANPRGGSNWAANALQRGLTLTSGAVAEPFLSGLAHPDQVFLNLFQGANAGDAVLRATRWLKWMIVNIGDPLYRPFPKGLAPFNQSDYNMSFLGLIPQSLVGGNPVSVLLHLSSPAPAGGLAVSFKSSRPDLLDAPTMLQLPEKAVNARISIPTHQVTSETIIRISMSAGKETLSNTLVLLPGTARP